MVLKWKVFYWKKKSVLLISDSSTDSDLPDTVEHLIIGDSLLRSVKISNNNSITSVKGGARIKDIIPLFEKTILDNSISEEMLANIKTLTLSVGTNNLSTKVPVHCIMTDYCELLKYLRNKLPNCIIGLFNVPPRYYSDISLLYRVKAFNNLLMDLVNFHTKVYVLQVFWQFIDPVGYMIPHLYQRDFLHFSRAGV